MFVPEGKKMVWVVAVLIAPAVPPPEYVTVPLPEVEIVRPE
jgi:hypothetical protein